jgi:Tfp pilus assembly protein PilP
MRLPCRAALVLSVGLAVTAAGQTQPSAAQVRKPASQARPPAAEAGKPAAPPGFSYSSGGRRDPFKDLLQGQSVRGENKVVSGLSDLNIDEVVLMGIIETEGKREAVISLTASFPMPLHVGDQLADGYVLAIEETQVVFRKTRDARGLPLLKPRDVVKDILAEEP